MAYNVITDTENIDTINFTNIASNKDATVFAGLQDTNKNINVLTDTLFPTYNISYDDSQTNWCSVTLNNTDDAPNTAKKISVSVTENTANNDRACKIYLKYKDRQTSNYIQINQSKPATQEPAEPVTATIRVYNNTNDTITGKHFVILSQVSTGDVPQYYMTVLDTYDKNIPANSFLDVGTNTKVTGFQNTWYAYVNETSSEAMTIYKIKDVSYIQNDTGSKQGNHYVTAATILQNGVIIYTGGASSQYRIGIDTNTSPTGYVCNDYPKSIAIIGNTQTTLKESFEFVNTLSAAAQTNNDYAWLCLVKPALNANDKQIGCNVYFRQNYKSNNNDNYIQETWRRNSSFDNSFAKKINSNAVNGAYDAFNTGDNTLRIYIYYSSTNVINNATLYRILKPAYTKEFDPIMSDAVMLSGFTSSYITEDDHGTWGGDITVHSKYIISGSNKYYIPIFVNSTEYVTLPT